MEFIFSVPRSNGFIFNTSTASIPLTVNTPGVSITEINDTIENGIYIRLGYKDPSWFTSNPTFILKSGEHVYNSVDGTYKIGDGVTQLSSLSFYGGSSGGSQSLSQTLTNGNSTGNQTITAGTNLSNILQVSDTVMGMSWNGVIGGNITLDDSIGILYHDSLAQIESQGITKVISTGRVDIESPVIRSTLDDGFNITRLTIDKNQTVSDTSTDNNIVVIDNISNKGIAYFDDYSANFTDNTLVTKGWVSNFVGTASAPSDLESVLGVGNSTGDISITSPNTLNTLDVFDTGINITSQITSLANVYLDSSISLVYNDNLVQLESTGDINLVGSSYTSEISLMSTNITLTSSSTASMTMGEFGTTFTGNFRVTSNNDNAGISIVSPPGFYYPSLGFYNVGNNLLGAITGYAGQLYISGVSGTPLIVNSAAINLPLETVNSLLYVDSGNNVKSAHLGVGLSFSGLTLSNTLDLSGYVPYTGATTNLDMGIYGLSASSLNIQGSSTLNGAINTAMSGSSNRLVESSSTGALTATRELIDGFLVAGTAATLLTTTASWTGVNYTGTAITGTYQGQQYYNNTYVYLAVNDNDWVRMARV